MMKIIPLLFLLTACMNNKAVEKQVKVVEITSMRHRSTFFKGDDKQIYEVNQGTYQPGDLMDCQVFSETSRRCQKAELKDTE